MEKTKVALVGMGTVGSGVAKLLLDYGDRTARHAGRTLWLEKVLVRNPERVRAVELPDGVLTSSLEEITENSEIKVVAQLIGGLEPARTIMLQLLESGKDVVTANKALLAEHGPELFDRARELGRSIAFEAAVGGGIPIITPLSQCLTANRIESIHAILNGTSNFILDQMDTRGSSYDSAVQRAQELGYAEADPTMDVDGSDAAQKLAILAHIGMGLKIHWSEIPCRGIDSLDPSDLQYARRLGYRVKLLATAQMVEDDLELHVAPTLVKMGTPLSEVHGAYNAIRVVGDAVGKVFFHGMGAGQMPTASAVVADLIDTAVGRAAITFRTLKLWSENTPRVTPRQYDQVPGRYYLRMRVLDEPGVMAKLTDVLGRQGVSIASIIQHEEETTATDTSPAKDTNSQAIVPIVIMTHETKEGALRKAVEEFDQLECVFGGCIRMPVRE
ncbi:Homoserine dehydrogenase [Planctomycetales bacterium 10988]|nr:Homoserine dehydrogenase [Planctomycetales bacterium 10988]